MNSRTHTRMAKKPRKPSTSHDRQRESQPAVFLIPGLGSYRFIEPITEDGRTILKYLLWPDCSRPQTAVADAQPRKLSPGESRGLGKEIGTTKIVMPSPELDPDFGGLSTDEQTRRAKEEQDRQLRAALKSLQEKCRPACILEWKDFELKAYPNGEMASYYNVRFRLTVVGAKRDLMTWVEWVKVPGGHTHYGCLGSVVINVGIRWLQKDKLEYAREKSGLQFVSAPTV